MKRLLASKARPLWALLALVVVLLPLVVFLVKRDQSVSSTSVPDLSAFAGRWIAHGQYLDFSSNGRAKYIARAYQWCGPGVPPPCDTIQNNTIFSGITEDMLFTHVAGKTAYGTITASSAGNTGRSVSFALDANDTAILTEGGHSAVLLCGPKALALASHVSSPCSSPFLNLGCCRI